MLVSDKRDSCFLEFVVDLNLVRSGIPGFVLAPVSLIKGNIETHFPSITTPACSFRAASFSSYSCVRALYAFKSLA